MDDIQTFFKEYIARHAIAFPTLMSFSVDPMYEPRYLKSSGKASADPSRVFNSTCSVLKVMTSVFLALSLRPTLLHALSTLCRSSCAWSSRLDKRAMSSAKSKSLFQLYVGVSVLGFLDWTKEQCHQRNQSPSLQSDQLFFFSGV